MPSCGLPRQSSGRCAGISVHTRWPVVNSTDIPVWMGHGTGSFSALAPAFGVTLVSLTFVTAGAVKQLHSQDRFGYNLGATVSAQVVSVQFIELVGLSKGVWKGRHFAKPAAKGNETNVVLSNALLMTFPQ